MVMKINCPLDCTVPDGTTVDEVPVSRHAWGDVMVCPNGIEENLSAPCGRAFLIKKTKWFGHIGKPEVIEPSCGCVACTDARFDMEVK